MQDAAFILNIFSFLPKRMKTYRNVGLVANFVKSAVFTYLELTIFWEPRDPSERRQEEDIINYVIYAVEGILI
jgi:hypothetical protein